MKEDEDLKDIPVLVPNSASAADEIHAHEHATAFVTKPMEFDEFLVAVNAIEGFSLGLVQVPNETARSASASADAHEFPRHRRGSV